MNSCHSSYARKKLKKKNQRQLFKTYNYQKWTKTNKPRPAPITAHLIQWIFYEVKKKKINDEIQNRKEKREVISSNKTEKNIHSNKYTNNVVLFNSSHIVMIMMYIPIHLHTENKIHITCFFLFIVFFFISSFCFSWKMKTYTFYLIWVINFLSLRQMYTHTHIIYVSDMALKKGRTNQIWNEYIRWG